MVHRLALTIGGLGAVTVMALAFVISGSPVGATDSIDSAAAGVEQLTDEVAAAPEGKPRGVRTVVDTVYVKPPSDRVASDDRQVAANPPTADPPPASLSPSPSADPTFAPSTSDRAPRATDDHRHGDDDRRDDDRHHDDDDDDDDDDGHHGRHHGGDDDDDDGDDHGGHGHDGDDDRHGDDDR